MTLAQKDTQSLTFKCWPQYAVGILEKKNLSWDYKFSNDASYKSVRAEPAKPELTQVTNRNISMHTHGERWAKIQLEPVRTSDQAILPSHLYLLH